MTAAKKPTRNGLDYLSRGNSKPTTAEMSRDPPDRLTGGISGPKMMASPKPTQTTSRMGSPDKQTPVFWAGDGQSRFLVQPHFSPSGMGSLLLLDDICHLAQPADR
ncbi:unnamed protein product [Prorocentrum cordatum]|uniref:Uncharacterized protein n=1 Tax=Prorocentrum cordatum TaxID=2364126 RepID=A0ABN9U477_9DINO|nr:unnamed protein product [Polarella glacialis]